MSNILICCLGNGLYCSGIILSSYSRAAYRVMVAIVFDYRNLFDVLKSVDFVENCVWLPLCLSLRMHEGQNRVPGSI